MKIKKLNSKLRAWGILLGAFVLIWSFAFLIGPWIQHHIPIVDQIFKIAEAQDINTNAYFYTEIEASYDGAQYLHESLKLSAPDEAKLTWPSVLCIIFCIVILGLGWRYLPLD